MASNADGFVTALTEYLRQHLSLPLQLVDDIPWQQREQGFDNGDIQICWICGLPYAWKKDRPGSAIELLATPVLEARRYAGKAVYLSDIVVHRDSPFQCFDDLADSRWAYNEPHSHSGCYVVRNHLAKLGKDGDFFAEIIESGAHQNSLQMILAGKIDAAAIDSWVLELELQKMPEQREKIRIIDTLGPSAFPPFIISKQVPLPLRQQLRNALLDMHNNPQGLAILQAVQISHFAESHDRDYDGIRQMAKQAQRAHWTQDKR